MDKISFNITGATGKAVAKVVNVAAAEGLAIAVPDAPTVKGLAMPVAAAFPPVVADAKPSIVKAKAPKAKRVRAPKAAPDDSAPKAPRGIITQDVLAKVEKAIAADGDGSMASILKATGLKKTVAQRAAKKLIETGAAYMAGERGLARYGVTRNRAEERAAAAARK